MWESEKLEKLERVSEEESGKVEETIGKIDTFPRNGEAETVETVEIKSEVESKEPIQVEPKVEPKEEPKVEPKVEPSRVSLKQKLRKNMLFRFKSRVCSTFTPPLACKCPPNRDIRS